MKKNHIHGVAVAQGVLLHESEAKEEEFQEGCVITNQTNGDGIVGWNIPRQNASD